MLPDIERMVQDFKKEKGNKRKKLLGNLIENSLRYTFFYCYDWMIFLPADETYMLHLFIDLLITQENAYRLKNIFLAENYMEQYMNMIEEKRSAMEKIYRQYFNSKTVQRKNHLYNTLLQMYYDPKSNIWISKNPDGTVRFTTYMLND